MIAGFSAAAARVGDEFRRASTPRGVQLLPLRAVRGVEGADGAGLLSKRAGLFSNEPGVGLSLEGDESGEKGLVGDDSGV